MPDGMSYPTWCRRFREWRPCRDATMRQNRRPGERLFVDYAGMTIPIMLDGVEHKAQVFVASVGVSGRLYVEATLTQKIDDWCASHVRCFEDMGLRAAGGGARQHQARGDQALALRARSSMRPTPICSNTMTSRASRRAGRNRATRLSSKTECSMRSAGSWRPLRKRVFHDLASLNRAIAALVRKFNSRPYADGTGENRYGRFESVDLPHMRPLPQRRWQRTVWRQNTVHKDYHIAIDYHFYSVPHELIGKDCRRPPARQPDRRLPPGPARRQPYPQQRQGAHHHCRGAQAGGPPARRHRRHPRPSGEERARYRAPCPRLRRRAHEAAEQSGVRLPLLLRRPPAGQAP